MSIVIPVLSMYGALTNQMKCDANTECPLVMWLDAHNQLKQAA